MLAIAIVLLAQTPMDTFFDLYDIPENARVFFGTREVTFTNTNPFRVRQVDLESNRVYSQKIRVDIPTSGGNFVSWHIVKTYKAGDTVIVKIPRDIDKVGRLRVIVPLDTFVYINGKITTQEGEVRDFMTGPLTEPQSITIKLDFRNKAGRRVKRSKTVKLYPGEIVTITDIESITEKIE